MEEHTERERVKFEAWAKEEGYILSTARDGYRFAVTVAAWDGWLASAHSREGAALEALRELLDAEEARFPPAEAGQAAQTAWAERRHKAREVARALLSGGEGASLVQPPNWRNYGQADWNHEAAARALVDAAPVHPTALPTENASRPFEKDAARYLWLRDVRDANWRPFALRHGYSAADADAAIDAAIAASPASQTRAQEGERNG